MSSSKVYQQPSFSYLLCLSINSEDSIMPQNNLTMNVRYVNNLVSVIDIQGEVTAFAENMLMDAYTQASRGQTKAIVLNFSDLEYMNSGGIGLLVTLLIRVQRQKQQLLAFGLNEHYEQIFELTRLNEAIGIYNSEAEAAQAVS
jgi:anti-sigma B factor antagonist